MTAEPWDLGPEGYRLGGFSSGWAEWDDKFRDVARRFGRGDKGQLSEFVRRMHGSSELFEGGGERGPWASINFAASHDGFTLWDMVSYNERHNGPNQKDNQDRHHANFSSNGGAERHQGCGCIGTPTPAAA